MMDFSFGRRFVTVQNQIGDWAVRKLFHHPTANRRIVHAPPDRGFITHGGFVGWWRGEGQEQSQPRAVARMDCPVAPKGNP